MLANTLNWKGVGRLWLVSECSSDASSRVLATHGDQMAIINPTKYGAKVLDTEEILARIVADKFT
jgi:hypothetical protein